jgi:hypothetical protein
MGARVGWGFWGRRRRVGCLALGCRVGGVWVGCGDGLDVSMVIGIGAGIGDCIEMMSVL